jgi:hypothetical protein
MLVINTTIATFSYGFFWGLYFTISTALTFWVYENSKTKMVRRGWLFAILTFVAPIIGWPFYLVVRNKLSKIEVRAIHTDDGKLEIFDLKRPEVPE